MRRLLVRRSDRRLLVRVEEIDWIAAADYYAELHVGARSHLVRRSLNDLEQSLDPTCFLASIDRPSSIWTG